MTINYSDQKVIKNKKSIFLAGPTPRNENVKSWRIAACQKLNELGFDGVVYVPEYSSWKTKADYNDQVMWERDALTNATVIMFWVPRDLSDMPAFTTNVEFGYWLHSSKIIYDRPDDAKKIKYLDWLYKEDYNKLPINNLDELLKEAITLANNLYDGTNNELLPLSERKILKSK
ncbi:MAG: nucleoside 2-deoxyribosyltransferase domain-containing protein [bacterium]|nr:nucleoside 2-deoxyribosyltransferase domain-containing protein [bacterium]